jgi:hypothetical protein
VSRAGRGSPALPRLNLAVGASLGTRPSPSLPTASFQLTDTWAVLLGRIGVSCGNENAGSTFCGRFASGGESWRKMAQGQYKAWVELAGKVSKETDREKLMRILEALCRALSEPEPDPIGSQAKRARAVDS